MPQARLDALRLGSPSTRNIVSPTQEIEVELEQQRKAQDARTEGPAGEEEEVDGEFAETTPMTTSHQQRESTVHLTTLPSSWRSPFSSPTKPRNSFSSPDIPHENGQQQDRYYSQTATATSLADVTPSRLPFALPKPKSKAGWAFGFYGVKLNEQGEVDIIGDRKVIFRCKKPGCGEEFTRDASHPFVQPHEIVDHLEKQHSEKFFGHRKSGCLGCGWNCSLLPHGGIAGSAFNLASATLGAGTLALPFAMQGSGILVGSGVLAIVCACTIYSVTLLVRLFEQTGYATYEDMAKNLIGPKFEKFTAMLIIIFCWGVTVVYVTAMGDVLGKVATVSWFPKYFANPAHNHILVIIFWACFLLPLSLPKEINSLRYGSLFGICASLFLVSSIVVHAAQSDVGTNHINYASFGIPMIAALPVFIFSYCCQPNVFEIYTELKPRTVRRMTISCALSMTICTLIYVLAGAAGSANFGTETRGNILKNYSPSESIYLAICYVAISFSLTFAFPLALLPTRDALLQLMGYESAYHTPTHVRILLCSWLAFLSLILGLFAPGIQVLFGILGGVCGSSLGFIFPALFALKSPGYSSESYGMAEHLSIWFLLIFGLLAGVLGTIMSVVNVIQNPPL